MATRLLTETQSPYGCGAARTGGGGEGRGVGAGGWGGAGGDISRNKKKPRK